jgi:hypothetical protein
MLRKVMFIATGGCSVLEISWATFTGGIGFDSATSGNLGEACHATGSEASSEIKAIAMQSSDVEASQAHCRPL